MLEPAVIYENENFLALDKPAGLLVYKPPMSGRRDEPTLVNWLLKKYPEVRNVGDEPAVRPGIVHRLDRDTSGLLLVARNQKYFQYLKSLFEEREIEKTYLALVHGLIKQRKGIIKRPIRMKSGSIRRTVWKGRMEKEAITAYRVKKYFKDYTLLELIPETGRTHQLRVHLASIGHPIVGDKIYGRKDSGKRLMLHAFSLEFSAADGRRIKLESEPPLPVFKNKVRNELSTA